MTTIDYLHMAAVRGNASLADLLVLAGIKLRGATWLSGTHTPGSLMAKLAAIK